VFDIVMQLPINYSVGGLGYDQPHSGSGWVGWQGFGGSTMLFNPSKNAAFSYVPNGYLCFFLLLQIISC
jgi:hypothetical protein